MTFPLSMEEACLAFLIVTIGSILQGSIGFGLGPFAVPLLVLVNPVFVPGPLLLSALLLTLLIFLREQQAVDFDEMKWAVSGRLSGTILGAVVLKLIPQNHLSLLFGIMVLAALFIFASGLHLPVSRQNLFTTGTLSGFMGTSSSIGGAPMALLYQHKPGPQLRGTLSGLFVIGTILSIAALAVIGKFGWKELLVACTLFPAILLGFFVSRLTARILDRGFIRPAVLALSGVAAFFLIIRFFGIL